MVLHQGLAQRSVEVMASWLYLGTLRGLNSFTGRSKTMMNMIPEMSSWLLSMVDSHHAVHISMTHLTHLGEIDWQNWIPQHDWVLMQSGDGQFSQDLAGSFQRGWNNFVKTGQVWAMLFGIVLGYMIKQFTTFG